MNDATWIADLLAHGLGRIRVEAKRGAAIGEGFGWVLGEPAPGAGEEVHFGAGFVAGGGVAVGGGAGEVAPGLADPGPQ